MVAGLVEELRSALRAVGSAERARGAKAYLKSDLEFYGVPAGPLRDVVRRFLGDHPELTGDQLTGVVEALWDEPVYDLRAAAVALLERRQRALGVNHLELVEDLLRGSHTWALVDWISTKVVAPIIGRHPEAIERLRRWAHDENFWVRRAALLAQLPDLRAGGGDFELFVELAVPMLGEREFFIRKAIGWVLRDTGRRRPELVAAFVERHRDGMSGLTYREATRNLPERIRRRLGPAAGSRTR